MNALKGSLSGAAGETFSSDTSTIDAIMSGIMSGAANLMSSGAEILRNIYDGITANLPTILSSGVEILSGIINGILEGLPQLITLGAQMVTDFAGFILDNLPTILDAGIQLLLNLVDGIITNLPAIVEAATTAMVSFVAGIAEHLPELLQKGIELIGKLIAGIISAIPKLIAALPQIFTAITGAFAKYDWGKIGIDLLIGIKNGILSAVSTVVDAAKQAASDIWEAVKGFFQIGSPSKLMFYAGEMVDLGFANGIKENQDVIDKAMTSLTPDATAVLQTSMTASVASPGSTLDGKIDNLVTLLNAYLPQIADGNVQITLDGDAGRLFRLMQRESIRNTQLVGTNAVLSATT
jgi:phage-related protein